MTVSNTSPAPPHSRRPGNRTRKPNYVLFAIGLLLVAVEIATAIFHPLPGPSQALLIALAVTITLYGVFPVNLMKGEFKGFVGRLVVAGPAAMGLFVFLIMLLGNEPCREDIVVMFATSNSTLSQRTIAGTQVRLLDIDSLSDDEVTATLKQLRTTVSAAGVVPKGKEEAELRRLGEFMLDSVEVTPRFYGRARALIFTHLDSGADVDGKWKELTKEMKDAAKTSREDRQALDRLKKQPFAFFVVGGEDKLQVVTERWPLRVGDLQLDVPVIANPAKKVNPRLEEAVVVKLPPASSAATRRTGA